MPLMISISGIRGVVGESLTPGTIVKYSSAFAEYCARGPVVIGRDGRITGKIIGNMVSSTLLSMGCDVIALGVVPTPTVQIAVEQLRAAGGISITASHNPIEWNGLKFLSHTGMFLNSEENSRLLVIAARKTLSFASWEKIGKHTADESFVQKHIDMVTRLPYMNVEKIRERKFVVVVDCINAAGGVIVPRLLRELGCDIIEMNCDVGGVFARTPEPVPENLGDLCKRVREERADLGIAVDPDGDRLVLITDRGQPFGEEYTVTSVVRFILEKESFAHHGSPLTTVVNLSTTRAVDDVAKQFRAKVFRTPVGEINVARRMKEVGAAIGGEGSGGVILPAAHFGRDAMVGIGLILQQLAESGGTLTELKTSLPHYSIAKSKVKITDENPDDIIARVQKRHALSGTINTDDGLRLDFADSWVHLRKSNTEPIIRIIAEAPTLTVAQQLLQQFINEIQTA